MQYVVGIDIGGTSIKAGILTEEGELIAKTEIPTRKGPEGQEIFEDLKCLVEKFLGDAGLEQETLSGIGIAVPGAVRGRRVVNRCANLNWGIIDVAEAMEARLPGIPIVVLNDANAAAYGEAWKGSQQVARNMVMVTLGTGVGGGVIVDGKVVEGAFGGAGEIGHLYAGGDVPCNCGNRGCLEKYASATGIARMAALELAKDPSYDGILRRKAEASRDASGKVEKGDEPNNRLDAKAVFDALKAGDPLAQRVAEDFGEKLGTALAQVACVVDPEVFVIGGGVSKAGECLLDYIRKPYREHAFHVSKDTEFRIASLGNDAGTYGAAWAACNRMEP